MPFGRPKGRQEGVSCFLVKEGEGRERWNTLLNSSFKLKERGCFMGSGLGGVELKKLGWFEGGMCGMMKRWGEEGAASNKRESSLVDGLFTCP